MALINVGTEKALHMMEKYKAFIVPKAGVKPGKVLEGSIRRHVNERLEAHVYPREIEFLEEMPMTKTGKILKYKLKAL